jgi:hypothetical protein
VDAMYGRFTDRARKIMQLANQEAQRFNHECIGTEHILLGLVKEGNGVAAYVLKNLGVDLRKICLEVEKLLQCSPDMVTMGKLPQTPRAKKVIEYAMHEARILNHKYVGSEHLLLGLLREEEGFAAQVLMNFGLRLEKVRAEVEAILGRNENDGKTGYSQTQIRWRNDKLQSPVRLLDDQTKRHVRQLADALAPLQEAKEKAVESLDFTQAAQLRDQQDQIWRELRNLNLPEWVLRNVRRLVNWPQVSTLAYSLDMYHDEPGEPDPAVSSVLPNPLMPPVKIVVGTVPRFPVSTLKAVLPPDDIGSPFFHALIPLLSPETVARLKDNHRGWVAKAFLDIVLARGALRGCPVLLSVVRPTLLSEEVRDEVFGGIHRTNCDFVLFEEPNEIQSVLGKLPPETKLMGL